MPILWRDIAWELIWESNKRKLLPPGFRKTLGTCRIRSRLPPHQSTTDTPWSHQRHRGASGEQHHAALLLEITPAAIPATPIPIPSYPIPIHYYPNPNQLPSHYHPDGPLAKGGLNGGHRPPLPCGLPMGGFPYEFGPETER